MATVHIAVPTSGPTEQAATGPPVDPVADSIASSNACSIPGRAFVSKLELQRLQNMLATSNNLNSHYSSGNESCPCNPSNSTCCASRSMISEYVNRIGSVRKSEGSLFDYMNCIPRPPQSTPLLPTNRCVAPAEATSAQHPAAAELFLESSAKRLRNQLTNVRLQQASPRPLIVTSKLSLLPDSRQPTTPTLPIKMKNPK